MDEREGLPKESREPQEGMQEAPVEGGKNQEEAEAAPPPEAAKPGPQNAKEQLYDKIPLSYKQVDILVKVLVGVLVVALVVGVLTGSRLGG